MSASLSEEDFLHGITEVLNTSVKDIDSDTEARIQRIRIEVLTKMDLNTLPARKNRDHN